MYAAFLRTHRQTVQDNLPKRASAPPPHGQHIYWVSCMVVAVCGRGNAALNGPPTHYPCPDTSSSMAVVNCTGHSF